MKIWRKRISQWITRLFVGQPRLHRVCQKYIVLWFLWWWSMQRVHSNKSPCRCKKNGTKSGEKKLTNSIKIDLNSCPLLPSIFIKRYTRSILGGGSSSHIHGLQLPVTSYQESEKFQNPNITQKNENLHRGLRDCLMAQMKRHGALIITQKTSTVCDVPMLKIKIKSPNIVLFFFKMKMPTRYCVTKKKNPHSCIKKICPREFSFHIIHL